MDSSLSSLGEVAERSEVGGAIATVELCVVMRDDRQFQVSYYVIRSAYYYLKSPWLSPTPLISELPYISLISSGERDGQLGA